MTADGTPAVPDTEDEREALAWFAEDPARVERVGNATPGVTVSKHAATIVRAALARDVPAGRDLTAQDVRRAPAEHGAAGVADYLNRIARPARDVPAPTDDPRGVAAVLALHRPVDGPLDSDDNRIKVCDHCIDGYESPYEYPCPTVKALGVGVSDRAGDDELRRGSLVDADGACVQCGHLATSHRPETGECTKCRGQFACYAPGIRAGGGVTAGQDERDRELAILHRSLSTFERIVDNAFNAIPDDVVAEDDSLASYIRAALAAAAAPAAAAARPAPAPDPLRAPVEALLAAWEDLTAVATTLDERVAEVRRHLDAPAPDDENVYRDTTRDELETQLRECRQDHRDLYLDVERRTAERDAARSEVAALRAAGDALADAAANLIVECARRTVAHQAVHTRDLTGWPPLEREVKAWRSGR